MSRIDTPVSIRFSTEEQLAAVEEFARRHGATRNAAIMALISFGLRYDREYMATIAGGRRGR